MASALTLEDCLCPICLEICYKPRSFPCGHSICLKCRSTLAAGSEICPECRLRCGQDSFRPNYAFARVVERAFPVTYALAKSKCLLLDWLWAKKESTGVFITVSSNDQPDDIVVPILNALDKLEVWSGHPSFDRIYALFAESVGCVLTRRPVWNEFPHCDVIDIRWDSKVLFLFKPEKTGPDWLAAAPPVVSSPPVVPLP